MIFGIDVSNHQGVINWRTLHQYAPWVAFAAIKVTEGTDYLDPYFQANSAGAKLAGLVRLFYHFGQPFSNHGHDEAAYFLREATDRAGTIPVLDVERDPGEPPDERDESDLLAYVTDWGHVIRAAWGPADKAPMLYSRTEYMQRHKLYEKGELARWGAWLASYQTKSFPTLPDKAVAIWQYGQGACPGIDGSVDFNVFNGTVEQLRSYAP